MYESKVWPGTTNSVRWTLRSPFHTPSMERNNQPGSIYTCLIILVWIHPVLSSSCLALTTPGQKGWIVEELWLPSIFMLSVHSCLAYAIYEFNMTQFYDFKALTSNIFLVRRPPLNLIVALQSWVTVEMFSHSLSAIELIIILVLFIDPSDRNDWWRLFWYGRAS